MTTRTTPFGGTDWSDGDVLYAADQNDTFNACTVYRQTESPSNISHTGDTADTLKATIPLDTGTGYFLIGLYVEGNLAYEESGQQGKVKVSIEGATLTTRYFSTVASSGTASLPGIGTQFSFTETRSAYLYSFDGNGNQDVKFGAFGMLRLPDATTNIKIYLMTTSGSNTVSFSNIVVHALFLKDVGGDRS